MRGGVLRGGGSMPKLGQKRGCAIFITCRFAQVKLAFSTLADALVVGGNNGM